MTDGELRDVQVVRASTNDRLLSALEQAEASQRAVRAEAERHLTELFDRTDASFRAVRTDTERRAADLPEGQVPTDAEPAVVVRSTMSRDRLLAAPVQAEASHREVRSEAERRLTTLFDQAAESYGTVRSEAERRVSELEGTRAKLEQSRQQEAREQARAERHRQRAEQLSDVLKEIHRSLFSGNVYELILKACLTLTGATRGLYVTTSGDDRKLRVRAAIDIDGYPKSPPSAFVEAMCRRVLDDDQTFVCNSPSDQEGLPKSDRPAEQFRNVAVTPSVLMANFDGVVLVADKPNGSLDDEDVETLVGIGDQASVAIENSRLRQELDRAYLATITALADAVEAKDPYTHGHCERVARYAARIAERLDLPDQDRGVVYYAALLHDVGKIAVSDGLLNKPGALMAEERELVRSHVRVGYDLISKIPVLSTVADAVLHHHEWYDGSGYPTGLEGEDIPLAARIVSVADAFGAMIDRRSYKEAYSIEQARAELERCSGTQFDPQIVRLFIDVLDTTDVNEPDENEDVGYGVFPIFGKVPGAS